MANSEWFDSGVSRPPGLSIAAVRSTVDYLERELADLVEIYHEQKNLFSGLVSIYATRGLDSVSNYEKHRNLDTAQQKFPDLKRRGSGQNPSAQESLECKASIRPWQLQSHYDHPGWYVVWRYLVDTTETYEEGKPVIVWRIDLAYLEQSDWKYESSRAGPSGGGRTETFGLRLPATKLRGKAVYQRGDVVLVGGKPTPANGE